jgi:hypothetical protein
MRGDGEQKSFSLFSFSHSLAQLEDWIDNVILVILALQENLWECVCIVCRLCISSSISLPDCLLFSSSSLFSLIQPKGRIIRMTVTAAVDCDVRARGTKGTKHRFLLQKLHHRMRDSRQECERVVQQSVSASRKE